MIRRWRRPHRIGIDTDALEPVAEIIRIAKDGNAAAQLLLRSLEHEPHRALDAMPDPERRAFLRDTSRSLFGKRWIGTGGTKNDKVFAAYLRIFELDRATTALRADARLLLDAGERRAVVMSGTGLLSQGKQAPG